MDFTPHARFKLDPQDVVGKDSDEGTPEIEKDKWLDDHHPFSVLLMPRSLLIFKDKAYSGFSFSNAIVNPCYRLFIAISFSLVNVLVTFCV